MSHTSAPSTAVFEAERQSLLGLAYRMLGSYADAEDAVQEAFVRWHQHPNHDEIASPRAYLTQITARLCLDRLKSARAKREMYVGPWLPEPLLDAARFHVDGGTRDQASLSELASDLSVALLLTLERLTPLERAAFLLHDVFDEDWHEVSKTLGRSEIACRQLASRARLRVREERKAPRYHASSEERERVLTAFGAAVATGDLSSLSTLLAEDALFMSDGGGEVRAALKPVRGRDRVARLILGLDAKARREGFTYTFEMTMVNDLPGFVLDQVDAHGARTVSTIAFDVDESLAIRAIYVVSNPHKLRHIQNAKSANATGR